MKTTKDVADTLALMANQHGRTFTQAAADMMMADLAEFEPHAILMALSKCRREIPRFPTVAEIVTRIQAADGRPGLEEAWALAPKSEHDAGYINNEIMQAWSVASNVLASGDSLISARMAFKEIYERVVREGRAAGSKPRWWLSRAAGGDRESADERAIEAAVVAGRLSQSDAAALLPAPIAKASLQIGYDTPDSDGIPYSLSMVVDKLKSKIGGENV